MQLVWSEVNYHPRGVLWLRPSCRLFQGFLQKNGVLMVQATHCDCSAIVLLDCGNTQHGQPCMNSIPLSWLWASLACCAACCLVIGRPVARHCHHRHHHRHQQCHHRHQQCHQVGVLRRRLDILKAIDQGHGEARESDYDRPWVTDGFLLNWGPITLLANGARPWCRAIHCWTTWMQNHSFVQWIGSDQRWANGNLTMQNQK